MAKSSMDKRDAKTVIQVTVNIQRGPGLPAAKNLWVKWWARVLADCKRELHESEAKE